MKAVLTIACYDFLMASSKDAATVIEALGKAKLVDRSYHSDQKPHVRYTCNSPANLSCAISMQIVDDDQIIGGGQEKRKTDIVDCEIIPNRPALPSH